MIQDNFLDCILIISSSYKQLCKLEKTYQDANNKKILDISLGKIIVDKLISNGKENKKFQKFYYQEEIR